MLGKWSKLPGFFGSSDHLMRRAGLRGLPFGMTDNLPRVSFKALRRSPFLASAVSNLVFRPLRSLWFSVNKRQNDLYYSWTCEFNTQITKSKKYILYLLPSIHPHASALNIDIVTIWYFRLFSHAIFLLVSGFCDLILWFPMG